MKANLSLSLGLQNGSISGALGADGLGLSLSGLDELLPFKIKKKKEKKGWQKKSFQQGRKIQPLSLCKGLSLELQGLSRPLDGGLKLLGLPNNFLLLNLNLLATLNNSDLHLFLLDFLVGLGLL